MRMSASRKKLGFDTQKDKGIYVVQAKAHRRHAVIWTVYLQVSLIQIFHLYKPSKRSSVHGGSDN